MEKKIGKKAESLGGVLQTINLSEVLLEDRGRKEYGNLQEMAESLRQNGQLQNIVVSILPATEENGKKYKLLAGGRRFRTATEILNWTTMFALVFPKELSELQILEIEHEENARRKNLEWHEDVALRKRIHDLKVQQHGAKATSASDGQSLRDTANDLDCSPATLSLDISLAKAMEVCPALFDGCKTKKDARKVLSKAAETILREETAKRIDAKIEASGGQMARLKSLIDRYIVRDFFEGVKDVPDECIDFVEIDPPFAINLMKVKSASPGVYVEDDYNEIDIKDYVPFLDRLFSECKRVMAQNSWGICWFGPEPWFEIVFKIIENHGFTSTRLTGKWIKPTGQCMNPAFTLANADEQFFYFRKGQPTLSRQGHTNIFQYSPVPPSQKYHPTEKPLELYLDILSTFCWEGARVMIPMLGSGKSLLAAEFLKLSGFGFDLSKNYKDSFSIKANEMFGKKETSA